jgi:hypothetical protein
MVMALGDELVGRGRTCNFHPPGKYCTGALVAFLAFSGRTAGLARQSDACTCGTRVARPGFVADNLTWNARRQRIEDLVLSIEGEFLETPSLRLTIPDAMRRFGVNAAASEALLEALVDAAVLFRTTDRVYGRLFPRGAAA